MKSDGHLINQILKICEKSNEPYNGFIKRLSITDNDININILSCIPGLSRKKSNLIIEKYKNIKNIIKTTEEELQQIEGIGECLSRNIKKFL